MPIKPLVDESSRRALPRARHSGCIAVSLPPAISRSDPPAAGRVQDGLLHQTLLGVTGSGKTFTIANLIAELQRPTLILAHNKTLAAQLYGEMKEFFPENAVEYFVSYYDYYQPEAYVPSSDTYIQKDASSTSTSSRCACPPPRP